MSAYMTTLKRLLLTGEQRIGIFVWCKTQKVPAKVYLDAHRSLIAEHGAEVTIHVSRLKLKKRYRGRAVIRYAYDGSGGGGIAR